MIRDGPREVFDPQRLLHHRVVRREEAVGWTALELGRDSVAVHRAHRRVSVRRAEVSVVAVGNWCEAPILTVRVDPKVPLAAHSGAIPTSFQRSSDRDVVRGVEPSWVTRGWYDAVALDVAHASRANCVPPGLERGARRRADRRAAYPLREAHTSGHEIVDVGRADVGCTVRSEVAVSHVIDEQH